MRAVTNSGPSRRPEGAGRTATIRPMEIVEREDTLLTLTEAAAAKIRELMAEEPEGEA